MMTKWQHALLVLIRLVGAVLIALSLPYAHATWGETYPGDGQQAFGFIVIFMLIGEGAGILYFVSASVLHFLLRRKRFQWILLFDLVLISMLVLLLSYAGVTAKYEDTSHNKALETDGNAVIPNERNGLRLVATGQSSDTTIAKGVSVRVAFTNVSTNPIVLMNHFDMCAVGPYFGFRQYSPPLPNGYVDHYFENSISFNRTDKPWIEIAPGQSYVFTSPVSFEKPNLLEIGKHTFRVIYFAYSGPTLSMVKEGDVPKDLWSGQIMSEALKVVVRE